MVLANKDMQIPPLTLITAALQFRDSVVVNLGFFLTEESSELNLKIGTVESFGGFFVVFFVVFFNKRHLSRPPF